MIVNPYDAPEAEEQPDKEPEYRLHRGGWFWFWVVMIVAWLVVILLKYFVLGQSWF